AKHIVGDDTTPYWQGESSSLRTCCLKLTANIMLSFFERDMSLQASKHRLNNNLFNQLKNKTPIF
ncbi:hypothetical protein, partial [Campylobacter helveticus]|uniref:hypothetical protein n=1 Tax=Campylobacter helveticus TaxID=28898 RepID=UPI001C3F29C8